MTGALTNHLWQSTLFAAAAGLLALAFRGYRAQVRYWLWLSGSLKFLVPFALLIGLGGQLPRRAEAPRTTPPVISTVLVTMAQPFPEVFPAAPTRVSTDWLPTALAIAWGCGFTAIALLRIRGWRRIRAAVRTSTRIAIPCPVDVRRAPGLIEPGVVGFWRPVLLLPEGIAEILSQQQMDAVLAHELCHVRRRDNLTAALHMIVEAIFWFHPLVWWIGARLVEEREWACDEAVLQSGGEPAEYARGILQVCRAYVESPVPCVSGVTGADLRKRIHAILSGRAVRDLSLRTRTALALAAVAALAAPIVVGMLHAQSAPATSAKFEVASIRPCKFEDEDADDRGTKTKAGGGGATSSPGRLVTPCETVEDIVKTAYVSYATGQLRRDPYEARVTGGPSWIRSERYRIHARAEGAPSVGLMRGPILQKLLEDRFQLQTHRETRDVPGYHLTAVKNGPKLQPYQVGSCTMPPDLWAPVPPGSGGKPCRVLIRIHKDEPHSLALFGQGASMTDLARLVTVLMHRPVVDRTGISGRFDFDVPFVSEEAGDDEPGPRLPAALVKDLGVKLDSAKGAQEFLVIDRIERQTGN
jgi:uncharacterized protein (TIGR03435 family)